MTKSEYLEELRSRLTAASVTNIDSRIDYYSEMIDDRIEDGMTEEDAIASMESIDSIVEAFQLEKPVATLVKEKVRKSTEIASQNGHLAIWIVLAILGSPLWIPLLIIAFSIVMVIAVVLFVLILTVFIILLSIGCAAVACIIAPFFAVNYTTGGLLGSIGGALVCTGIVILLWNPVLAVCKWLFKLIGGMFKGLKRMLMK